MKKNMPFQTEVKRLLHLMIHSLYSDKEIFLRELISNAADAVDKLRFEALHRPELLGDDPELKITVVADRDAKTLTVSDNGIGMSDEEIVENLGTIAKSGTAAFVEQMTGDGKKDAGLIGRFGVGFYSAFMAADRVTVESRRAGLPEEAGVRWTSTGEGEFSVETINKKTRGTDIILHLKPEAEDFLSDYNLRRIVTTYSDHIAVPIYMKKSPEYDDEGKPKPAEGFEAVNRAKALWTLPKSEISDERYREFYRHVAHDFDDALAWTHFKVEGRREYTGLLYIPKHAPFDLYERNPKHGVKLYVQRVFITDDAQKMMPLYLRFVRGIIDCDDLPLNVSREILQQSDDFDAIRAGSVKKILSLLEDLRKNKPEDYAEFWRNFGATFKEGLVEDLPNQKRIADLCLFATMSSPEQKISLNDYIAGAKEGQNKIYCLAADDYAAGVGSPHLEIFRKKGIDVLILTDRVDEWAVDALREFDGKALVNVSRGVLDLDEADADAEKTAEKPNEETESGAAKIIKDALGERVSDVRPSRRLTESPACLVSGEHDMSRHFAHMLEAAGATDRLFAAKPILEINPEHPLIAEIAGESDADRQKIWSRLIYDQALIAEGGKPENPGEFIKTMNRLLLRNL